MNIFGTFISGTFFIVGGMLIRDSWNKRNNEGMALKGVGILLIFIGTGLAIAFLNENLGLI